MESNNFWLKLVFGLARYILGILILVSGPLILLLLGKDPMIVIHALVHPMLTFSSNSTHFGIITEGLKFRGGCT